MPLNILPLLEKNVMVTTTYFSDHTTATNNNSNTKNKNKKLALTVSLAAIIVISSSLSFLVQITTLESVDAQTNIANTTITTTPPSITAQNPVDARTGQIIAPPASNLVETDPVTGQKKVIADVIGKDRIATGASAQKTSKSSADALNMESFNIPSQQLVRSEPGFFGFDDPISFNLGAAGLGQLQF